MKYKKTIEKVGNGWKNLKKCTNKRKTVNPVAKVKFPQKRSSYQSNKACTKSRDNVYVTQNVKLTWFIAHLIQFIFQHYVVLKQKTERAEAILSKWPETARTRIINFEKSLFLYVFQFFQRKIYVKTKSAPWFRTHRVKVEKSTFLSENADSLNQVFRDCVIFSAFKPL